MVVIESVLRRVFRTASERTLPGDPSRDRGEALFDGASRRVTSETITETGGPPVRTVRGSDGESVLDRDEQVTEWECAASRIRDGEMVCTVAIGGPSGRPVGDEYRTTSRRGMRDVTDRIR